MYTAEDVLVTSRNYVSQARLVPSNGALNFLKPCFNFCEQSESDALFGFLLLKGVEGDVKTIGNLFCFVQQRISCSKPFGSFFWALG